MWAFAIKQKMTVAILLFTVLGVVLLTNMREQRTISRINTAVTSIYEDRLVVAQYILQLSKHTESIITILEKDDRNITAQINDHLSNIDKLNALYQMTVLTELERTNFENFKQLCRTISINNIAGNRSSALSTAHRAEDILQTLSSIQVEEGKNQLDEVLSMTHFSNILSYFELTVLIVIAFIIQALVLASKTMTGIKKPSHENLN